MNVQAEKHLAKAEDLLAKGDQFYRRAAREIIAAQKADPTLSNREIGERFNRSATWIRNIVAWATTSHASAKPTPFARESGISSEDRAAAKKTFREAPMELVERIVSELPPERAAVVAKAALSKPGVGRELAKTPEATASVRRVSNEISEQHAQETDRVRRQPGSTQAVLGVLTEIVGPLNRAKVELAAAYEAAREYALTSEQLDTVNEQLDEVASIIDWFKSYLQSGNQSFEDELRELLN